MLSFRSDSPGGLLSPNYSRYMYRCGPRIPSALSARGTGATLSQRYVRYTLPFFICLLPFSLILLILLDLVFLVRIHLQIDHPIRIC
jgi:hypothetical protein